MKRSTPAQGNYHVYDILVALDGSETSSSALDAALTLASESAARLTPVYVVDYFLPVYDMYGYDPSILLDAFREEGQRVTQDAAKRMKTRGVSGTPRMVTVEPVGEDVAQRILIVAKEIDADLIVMGTHGRRGFRRLVLGSVAERVLRRAACPVLLIPASRPPEHAAEPIAVSTQNEQS
ncbi:universal stress protein UspA [Burkholderia stagnalis]|uniref:universal stress protein n=1 Tax=Burkholderia stagnalis TaxID=1503054 RepID=UPI00075FD38E|nr:universal stress protein [Burkholderia stagnalis]KWK49259.1 universal stress protein UspA [Burkholderia stagnalis]KWK57392.1 universal stress protein UspA [Burkholderia stagnalis]